jgi:hypothetical protein
MPRQELTRQDPAELTSTDPPRVGDPGTVPDALRQRVCSFFLDVVRLREQLGAMATGYPDLAAAVQFYADEIDDYDRAMVVEEQVGVRLVFDLLLDIAHQIGQATGWRPQAVSTAVAIDPLAAWPRTGWPLPADA